MRSKPMIKKQKVSVWVTVKIMADILEVTEPKQVMNTTLQNLFKDNEVLIDPKFRFIIPIQFDIHADDSDKSIYHKKLHPRDYMHLSFGGAK